MGIRNTYDRGYHPYTMEIEPWFNGGPCRRSNYPNISPRYTSGTTAENFTFGDSGDYSPSGNYVDLDLQWPGNSPWYARNFGQGGISNQLNHTGDNVNGDDAATPFSQRYGVSVWMDLRVGNGPHPGYGTAKTYIAILRNANGAHHGGSFWNGNASGPFYNSPRSMIDGFERVAVSGDNYGTGNYRGWCCLAQFQNATMPMNATTLRLINLGGPNNSSGLDLKVQGFKMIYHISPTWADRYGGFNL